MDVSLFDFDLPESAIALRPARPRDAAKLLQVKGADLSDHIVRDLPELLRAGDLLVVNETRVLPAALAAIRPARDDLGKDVTVDINLLEAKSDAGWIAFARPAKRVKIGDRLEFSDRLSAQVTAKDEGQITLEFSRSGEALSAAIEAVGHPPLPPYIARKRATDAQDVADYQTIYARESGSVAAPTAGLHFTPELFDRLEQAGIGIAKLTLHVGAGTFLPVKSEDTAAHKMHSEFFILPQETVDAITACKAAGGRVIAVGTTSLRALEAAAQDGTLQAQARDTDIFITPGYKFHVIDGLMTNFHLPKSTLFMLVSALAGRENMLAAYRHAIASGYRFYSYGDSSLLWCENG